MSGPLFASFRRRVFLKLGAHDLTCSNCGIGLKPAATRVADPHIEQGHRAEAPDVAIAEDFNRMLEFMPDICHEIAIRRPRVDKDTEHSVWTHRRHRMQQAGVNAVPALAFCDIDDSVRGANLVDQAAKCFRLCGGFDDDRHNPRYSPPAHAHRAP